MNNNDNKGYYNSLVVFQRPIQIMDDRKNAIAIYGLLYNRRERHKDDLWTWELNRYLCYLLGCEKIQKSGCRLAPELIITQTENMIALNVELKNLIYRIMKDKMIDYLIVEPKVPFKIYETETEDIFVISKKLLQRVQYKNE